MDLNAFDDVEQRLLAFMHEVIVPAERDFATAAAPEAFGRPPLLDRLRAQARDRGLYHLFSATRSAAFGFNTVQLARLAEITGRSPVLAQDALGSINPDAEAINLLHRFGTPSQQARWLEPLRAGTIGCALCITEPDVASSDPTALKTSAQVHGDAYVLNGHKSWSLGALSPICKLLIVLAQTDADAAPRRRHSLLLVPRDAPGVRVGDSASYFGWQAQARGGLPRVSFDAVRLPQTELLGPRGEGLATVQTSLGPARLFHCMRLVGAGERALELMCERLRTRLLGGRQPMAEHGLWMDRIAEARIRIEQARAIALATAQRIDAEGLQASATALSMAKAAIPPAIEWVIDTAIQAHGSDGMSHELPLATLWAVARTLRFSDGPDEVHRMVVARAELKRARAQR